VGTVEVRPVVELTGLPNIDTSREILEMIPRKV
jgi:hypothetical protein